MIDEKLQAELRAKYNPDGSLLRQHQMKMVEMLKYFDDLCQKHGIRYWLSSGNCIGVVRHGGFVPWDDDIDVEMLREDYLKLEKVFKETDDYVLQTWKNDRYYVFPYAKMRDKNSYIDEYGKDSTFKYRGIFIDVFQLESSPRFICLVYRRLIWSCLLPLYQETNKIKKIIFLMLKYLIFGSVGITRFLFGWLPNNKLRHTYGVGFEDKIREKKDFENLKRAKFENVEVNIPGDVDAYLKKIYGNYMEIPPENKRQMPHACKVVIR